LDEVILLQ